MGGICIKYQELLSVRIELPFYANLQGRKGAVNPRPDISIAPDAETLELFKRMDLIMRETAGGVIILARTLGETPGGNPVMRFPAPKGGKITLLLRLGNTDVLTVNDLPAIADSGRLLYLTNTVPDGAAARNNLHLSASAAGIFGGSDALGFARATYRFVNGMPVNAATTFVRHLLTGAEIAPAACTNEEGGANLLFDLSALPAGVCELWIAGALEDTFYHLVDTDIRPVFGVVELSLNSGLEENYRAIEPDRSLSAQRPSYVVRFVSRESFWRYTFRLQPASPLALELAGLSPAQRAIFLDHLNIVSNDSNVTFTAHPSGADNELIYVTDAAAALREAYFNAAGTALSLSLTKNIGDANAEAIIKRGLPYPSSQVINAASAPDYYSEIFITI